MVSRDILVPHSSGHVAPGHRRVSALLGGCNLVQPKDLGLLAKSGLRECDTQVIVHVIPLKVTVQLSLPVLKVLRVSTTLIGWGLNANTLLNLAVVILSASCPIIVVVSLWWGSGSWLIPVVNSLFVAIISVTVIQVAVTWTSPVIVRVAIAQSASIRPVGAVTVVTITRVSDILSAMMTISVMIVRRAISLLWNLIVPVVFIWVTIILSLGRLSR